MRTELLHRLQRLLAVLTAVCLLAIGLIVARASGVALPSGLSFGPPAAETPPPIALISGHAGFDAGAICEDNTGRAVLKEVDVNAQIAERVAQQLRRDSGTRTKKLDVLILEEYDSRLNGLQATVLLSLHIDSCVGLSGYKAAHRLDSPIPVEESRLLDCIDIHYAAATNLRPHPDTITHDMTENHAFQRIDPQTPAAILEMGFLGGDQTLLTAQQEQVATGIAESIRCFIHFVDSAEVDSTEEAS